VGEEGGETAGGRGGKPFVGPLARVWNRGYAGVESRYRRVIRWVLSHRFATLGGLSALLCAALLLLAPLVPMGWFSNPDQGFFITQVSLSREAGLQETARAVRRCEQVMLAHPAVETVYSEVGHYKTLFGPIKSRHRAEVQVVLTDDEDRPSTTQVIAELRQELVRSVPGAELLLKELGAGEMAIRDDVMIELVGPDPAVLAELADMVEGVLRDQPNLVDIDRSGDELGPEIRVTPQRARLADAGLSAADLGLLLRAAIEGDTDGRVRGERHERPIRVRLGERWRGDLSAVAATTIQTASGAQVPLRELARVEEVRAPVLIARQERQRRLVLFANLSHGAIGDTAAAIEGELDWDAVPKGYLLRVGGEEEQRSEAQAELGNTLLLAVVLITMLLAGLLESLVHPFTILSTLPLALIGVLLALGATGVELDIFGLMALVMLVGIVVNNAILMLEETGHLRREGVALAEALEEGALRRLRPILMTSLSTMAGMVPLALALGAGAELRQSMALVSIGGVGISALLVLVACPAIYHLAERGRARFFG